MTFRNTLPRNLTDAATITILSIASFQTNLFLLIPVGTATLLLSSLAQSHTIEHEQLVLLSIGLPRSRLVSGPFVKGVVLAILGVLPFQLVNNHLSIGPQRLLIILSTVMFAGIMYTIPFAKQITDHRLVGQLKS